GSSKILLTPLRTRCRATLCAARMSTTASPPGVWVNSSISSCEPSCRTCRFRSKARECANELELEAGISGGGDPRNVARLGEPSMFACPECHGTLMRLRGDRPQRYRCRTGHSLYSRQSPRGTYRGQ